MHRPTTSSVDGSAGHGAVHALRYPHDEVDDEGLFTEVLAPELVAAHLWLTFVG